MPKDAYYASQRMLYSAYHNKHTTLTVTIKEECIGRVDEFFGLFGGIYAQRNVDDSGAGSGASCVQHY